MKSRCLFNIENYRKNGFSMAEALVLFLIVGVISAAAVPMMTQMAQIKTGTDKNTLQCITENSSDAWFDETTGDTSALAQGTECYAAVQDAIYNRDNSLNTAIWYADRGTAAQKIMAKKILRASCDNGGAKACDYFINTCWKTGSSSAPYCDDISSFLDITYYLHKDPVATTNSGVNIINGKLENQLEKRVPGLVNEVAYACNYNQAPTVDNQNLDTNIACGLVTPEYLIDACNDGLTGACEAAYDNGYNTSCTAVKTNWPEATTGTYKLSADGSATTRDATCNMTSVATAAVSGCSASPYVSGDCTAGYDGNYNRTCANIFANYSVSAGTYNLTSSGPPPTAPVSTSCDPVAACIAGGVGTVCDDGTVYAGLYRTYRYFATTSDQTGTYTWNNGSATTTTTSVANGFEGPTNTDTLVITKAGNSDAPFLAAKTCYDLVSNNRTDWFLPASGELYNVLYVNRVAIGNFTTSIYLSSTEWDPSSIINTNFSSGTTVFTAKNTAGYVRCMRRQ